MIGGFDSLSNSNIPLVSALVLGLMTAISPCPMATNIAAIAYIVRKMSDRKYAVTTGALYTLGRMFSYTLIGVLIIVIGLETPVIAMFLQNVGEKVLGPLLIIIGLLMLFIDRIAINTGGGWITTLGNRFASWGMIGGFLLGVLFALAFCPYSAVLYFGILIPLALSTKGGVTLPAIYAIGTGLPVLVIGTLLSLGISGALSWVNVMSKVERILRFIIALVFIGVGIYYLVIWIQTAMS